MSAKVTIVYWRDMPAQVIARQDRETKRLPLEGRFQEAIDMAAMRGDAHSSDAYLEGWRHGEPEVVEGDVESAARSVATRLEEAYDRERIKKLVAGGGHEKG